MRLDAYLARAGLGSRTDVKQLIRKGQVTVDGQTVTRANHLLSDQPQVEVAGSPVRYEKNLHLMMNKAAGYVTSRVDEKNLSVYDLLPPAYRRRDLAPVGRLDRDTTGLLLWTTNGTLNHRLGHPRRQIWKTYRVTFSGPSLQPSEIRQLTEGLVWGEKSRFLPARLSVLAADAAELSIQEGQFHQVKRMFQALDRTVITLERIQFGPLKLDRTIPPGGLKPLTIKEVSQLYLAVDLKEDDQES